MEELYKTELETLLEYAQEKGYVPLSKIIEVFNNPSEELLDDVVKYLENANIEVTGIAKMFRTKKNCSSKKSMTSSKLSSKEKSTKNLKIWLPPWKTNQSSRFRRYCFAFL